MSEVDWAAFTDDDWDLLTVMAKMEGMGSLMYEGLRETGKGRETGDGRRETVPPGVHKSLAKEYYATAAYNTLLFSELGRILTALDEAQIPVILLKGAALAQTLYPDPALRPMSDLDLLVPLEEVDLAVQAVRALGYQSDDVGAYWPGLERGLGCHA